MRKGYLMGKRLNSDEMQTIFEILQKSYDVYGPKIYQGTGCFSDTDIVRYGLLNSWEELVWDQKSDYSFKEVLFPVSETILYFTEDEMKTADGVARQRLIFLKSCDFHALKRLGEDFLIWADEDTIIKVILNTYKFVKEYIDPNAPGGKEHVGYIIDRVGFAEYKKWALDGVELPPETIVKDNIYWSGIYYR